MYRIRTTKVGFFTHWQKFSPVRGGHREALKSLLTIPENQFTVYYDYPLQIGEIVAKTGDVEEGVQIIETHLTKNRFEIAVDGKVTKLEWKPSDDAQFWISALQSQLDRKGLLPGGVDGRFGPDTKAALKRCYYKSDWECFSDRSPEYSEA